MVAQILRRNVDVVKSMLASAAARPGFNPTGDAMHHRSRHRSLFRAIFPTVTLGFFRRLVTAFR
jgi:hypothetical protein